MTGPQILLAIAAIVFFALSFAADFIFICCIWIMRLDPKEYFWIIQSYAWPFGIFGALAVAMLLLSLGRTG